MRSNRIVGILLAAAIYSPFPASSQDRPALERTELKPNWDTAAEAKRADEERDREGVTRFRAAAPAGIEQTQLPVLVPGTGPVRAQPTFATQGTAYSSFYPLTSAQLAIMGSVGALNVPEGDPLAAQLQAGGDGREPKFDVVEGGAELSFERFGASYVLQLTCDAESDQRCTNAEFLKSIYDTLVTAGGSKL